MQHKTVEQPAMPLASVSWAWKLPLIFGIGTTILLVVACRQETQFWNAHWGLSDTPWESQSPFRLLAQALNGPGYYLTFWLPALHVAGELVDLGRIPGIIFFWLCVGWSLDKKPQGMGALLKSRTARVSVDFLFFFSACLILVAVLINLGSHQLLPSKQLWHYLSAIGLRGSFLGGYVLALWAVALLVIFGWKLLGALSTTNNGNNRLASSRSPRLPKY